MFRPTSKHRLGFDCRSSPESLMLSKRRKGLRPGVGGYRDDPSSCLLRSASGCRPTDVDQAARCHISTPVIPEKSGNPRYPATEPGEGKKSGPLSFAGG